MIAITVTPSRGGGVYLDPEYWPLWVACAIVFVAGFINLLTLTVPNWLSFLGILSAWVVGLLLDIEFINPTEGGVASVIVSMVAGGLILIPFYVTGWLEGGCVWMQAAYGAWLGCTFPVAKAATLVCVTTVAGALLTTMVGLVVRLIRRLRKTDPKSIRDFRAQVTLSLGTLAALALWLKMVP